MNATHSLLMHNVHTFLELRFCHACMSHEACVAAVQSAMKLNQVWWLSFDSAFQCAGKERNGKELGWSGSGCGEWQSIFLPGCGGLGGLLR